MIQSARIIYKFKIPFHDSSVSNHRDKICSANLALISGRRHNKKEPTHENILSNALRIRFFLIIMFRSIAIKQVLL